MAAIAPNLTVLVGELVGARLIAHAGSLINLAKVPASTVQVLSATVCGDTSARAAPAVARAILASKIKLLGLVADEPCKDALQHGGRSASHSSTEKADPLIWC